MSTVTWPNAVVERKAAMPRVLVVEDDELVNVTLVRWLTKCGYDVAATKDGNDALSLADAFQPAVIVLDIGLPGLTGYDVARRLRGGSACSDALIIALTGYGTEACPQICKESGVDHRMTKPPDFHELGKLIRGHLG